MKDILNLIKRMRPGEIKLLRHFFKFQSGPDTKRAALFESLLKYRNCNDFKSIENKLIESLYLKGENSEKGFEKLKTRLKNDILNIILLQDPVGKNKKSHENAVFECRRLTLQAEVLFSRGLYSEGSGILQKASMLAKKNELFTELLLIDSLRSNFNIKKSNEPENISYSKKIDSINETQQKLRFAQKIHDRIDALAAEQKTAELLSGNFAHQLEQLLRDWESCGAAKIGYYYLLSGIKYYRGIRQYSKSMEFGTALLKLEKEEADIFKTIYFTSYIHIEVARCYMHVNLFDKAIFHSAYALSNSGNDMKNYIASLELFYYSYVHQKEYSRSIEVCQQALLNPYLQANECLAGKWWYYKASSEIRLNKTKEAINSIRKCQEIIKDKSSLALSANLLESICRMEAGDYDWLEYKTESLKKFLLRNPAIGEKHENRRSVLFFKLLRALQRENFDFTKMFQSQKENIALLNEASEQFSRDLFGFEIYRYDDWISSKLMAAGHINRQAQSVA